MRSIYNATGNLMCLIFLSSILYSFITGTQSNLSEIELHALIGKNILQVFTVIAPMYISFWIGYYIVSYNQKVKRTKEIHDALGRMR